MISFLIAEMDWVHEIKAIYKKNQSKFERAIPSGLSFILTMSVGHYTFGKLGVHCAMPGFSSLVGIGIVCGASLASKWMSKNFKNFEDLKFKHVSQNQIILSCLSGIILFKLARGRFWSVLPSPVDNLGAFNRRMKGSLEATLSFIFLRFDWLIHIG